MDTTLQQETHPQCLSIQKAHVQIGRHDEQIINLTNWQNEQNHNIEKLHDLMIRVDEKNATRIEFVEVRMGKGVEVVNIEIQKVKTRVDERLNALMIWLIGLLASSLLAIGLLLANLALGLLKR